MMSVKGPTNSLRAGYIFHLLKASSLEVFNKPLFDMIECEASQNYLEFWTRDHFADIIASKSLDTQLIN